MEPAQRHASRQLCTSIRIRAAAFRLFVERGYDETTIDDIAHASGVARRTFFRYFDTKEAVVIEALAESGAFLASLIAERPASEPPMISMNHAFQRFLTHYQESSPEAWDVLNLIQTNMKLHARFLYERDRWRQGICEVLIRRSVPKNQAEVVAAAALGVLTLIYERWHADSHLDIVAEFETAFGALDEAMKPGNSEHE